MSSRPERSAWSTPAIALAVAFFAIVYGIHSDRRAAARLAAGELHLATAERRQRQLADQLKVCRERRADPVRFAPPPGRVDPLCPEPPPCPPTDSALDTLPQHAPPSLQERERSVREHLRARLEASIPDEEMDGARRERALDILMRIRDLRTRAIGSGRNDAAAVRDPLQAAQRELIELTGMGAAELLHRLRSPDPEVSRAPEEAAAIADGAVRKRFADELAVALGITEPGSVEVLQDGEWQAR
jgi:hypothetical protein